MRSHNFFSKLLQSRLPEKRSLNINEANVSNVKTNALNNSFFNRFFKSTESEKTQTISGSIAIQHCLANSLLKPKYILYSPEYITVTFLIDDLVAQLKPIIIDQEFELTAKALSKIKLDFLCDAYKLENNLIFIEMFNLIYLCNKIIKEPSSEIHLISLLKKLVDFQKNRENTNYECIKKIYDNHLSSLLGNINFPKLSEEQIKKCATSYRERQEKISEFLTLNKTGEFLQKESRLFLESKAINLMNLSLIEKLYFDQSKLLLAEDKKLISTFNPVQRDLIFEVMLQKNVEALEITPNSEDKSNNISASPH